MKTKILTILSLFLMIVLSTTSMAYVLPFQQMYKNMPVNTCLGSACYQTDTITQNPYSVYEKCKREARDYMYSYEARRTMRLRIRLQQYANTAKQCYEDYRTNKMEKSTGTSNIYLYQRQTPQQSYASCVSTKYIELRNSGLSAGRIIRSYQVAKQECSKLFGSFR